MVTIIHAEFTSQNLSIKTILTILSGLSMKLNGGTLYIDRNENILETLFIWLSGVELRVSQYRRAGSVVFRHVIIKNAMQ